MNKRSAYEAVISYEAEPISILDRNIERIAISWCGDRCAGDFASHDHKRRRLAYSFRMSEGRQNFISAVRRFLKTADFGVEVTVE